MNHMKRYALCPVCNFFVPAESEEQFCPICGAKLIRECLHCGKPITNPYDRFCPFCGEPYRKKHSRGKSKGKNL
ncbi:MAG TPA: hypothetical protein ENF18_05570 [candidate division WOR-3 bacterium]|uniref:DZANK-type domain-containing protein n=1 Tax=candidate division WOR-3 bacterium TaxID=2052148 RepID=A0A7C0ZET1_UNCW3|nr:hypothetical protein [candidate division WOR-3 bacterium]